MRANAHSKVEKGTKSELPTANKAAMGSTSKPERSDGLAPANTPSTTRKPANSSDKRRPTRSRSGQSRAAAIPVASRVQMRSNSAKTTAGPKSSKAGSAPKKSKPREGDPAAAVVVNGRKFDQVNPVECVDEQFYGLLVNDLELIEPSTRRDFYDSYFNTEYAKTIEAIVDQSGAQSSASPTASLLAGPQNGEPRAAGEVLGGGKDASVESAGVPDDVLGLIRTFWSATHERYLRTRASLNLTHLPSLTASKGRRKRSNLAAGDTEPRPVYQAALENYRYLLNRLEQLKAILFNGEEALIAVNNRVRKLNQVVREEELQRALCACITCRGGRAALMLMNEIFVDKNSQSLLERPEVGAKKADDAARDTAEFCSYWYGDTIRAETMQREQQIKKLVLELAKEKAAAGDDKKVRMENLQNKSISGDPNQVSSSSTVKPANPKAAQSATSLSNATSTNLGGTGAGSSSLTETTSSSSTTSTTNGTTTTTTTTITTKTTVKIKIVSSIVDMTTLWMPNLADWIKKTLNMPNTLAVVSNKIRPKRQVNLASDESDFSTPFDQADLYSDDMADLEPSASLQSFTLANYRRQARFRRQIFPSSNNNNDTQFEQRMGAHSGRCAMFGFSGLLDIAYDQNALMYETSAVKRDHKYIKAIREAFTGSFEGHWRAQRDSWSKKFASGERGPSTKQGPHAMSITGAPTDASRKSGSQGRTSSLVDQNMDAWASGYDSMASSYDRGAALGFTIGRFVGTKAAHQWPDPAELNTFTYDSIFLAGVGHGHTEADSKRLERLIVSETAKRIAFTEANRKSFGHAISAAYLNGAYLVPVWGILHAQRAIAKQLGLDGAKVGYEAALQASKEFGPKAMKFFADHQHQRSLAAPYKSGRGRSQVAEAAGKWLGLADKLAEVQLESELNGNISHAAIGCGQKSGALMGALMGLLVTPEAFETYTRSRGSLEALENEFNQYKLGAMRGYELGESWAYLNYTAELNLHLKELKSRMSKHNSVSNSSPANKLTNKHSDSSSSSSFDSKSKQNSLAETTNTNNIFQYMVLNYGPNLVSNHSSGHMLKFRSPSIDDLLLEDLKVQARDLVAPERLDGLGKVNETLATHHDPDDPFETIQDGRFVGDLKGAFTTVNHNRTKPIKFNIIDLGVELELEDQPESQNKPGGLDESALTGSLAKPAKVFLKFNVARRKKAHNASQSDIVAAYLNSQQFDEGDGYLRGTFSMLTSASNTTHPGALVSDDFSHEVSILDSLFERVEAATVETVNLVEQSQRLTTMAPRRLSELSATSSMAPVASATSSTTPIPTTSFPGGTTTVKPKPSLQTTRKE